MLADNLKNQTLTYHQQLEKKLVGQINGLQTTANYLQLQQLFYSYFNKREDRFKLFINQDHSPNQANQHKTEAVITEAVNSTFNKFNCYQKSNRLVG